MTIVLEIKEKLKSIYAEYAYAINMVLKFLLALMVFMSINKKIGYLDMLTNIYPGSFLCVGTGSYGCDSSCYDYTCFIFSAF